MVIAFLTIACIVAAINTLLLFRINPKQDGPYPLIFFAIFIAKKRWPVQAIKMAKKISG